MFHALDRGRHLYTCPLMEGCRTLAQEIEGARDAICASRLRARRIPSVAETIYSCRPHSAVRAHFLPTLLLSKFTVARTSDTLAGRGHGPCFVVPCGYAYHQQQYHHASQAFGSSSHWNRLELYRPPRRLLFYETRSILQLPKASALVAPGPS